MRVKVGNLAETRIRTLAAKNSLTCNKAQEDEKGWDFLLEFPPGACGDAHIGAPLDQGPSPPKCLVQAKGTTTDTQYKSVKLSNWRSLVRSPLPAFFFVQEYNDLGVESDCYLIHVGQSYITRVLERLRQLEAEEEDSDLSKRYLNLNWSDQQPLNPDDPATDFKETICAIVGEDLNAYCREKADLLNSLGYEEFPHRVRVRFQVPEQYEDSPEEAIVDLQLGLLPAVDLVEANISETRFGVELPKETEIGSGTLEVRNAEPAEKGTLEIRLSDESQSVFIPVGVYTVGEAIATQVDPDILKVKLGFSFGRILLHKEKANISLTLPHDERVSFTQLKRISSLIRIMDAASSTEDRDLVFAYENRFSRHTETDEELPERWSFWAEVMEKASRIAHHFDIEDIVEVTPEALLKQWQVIGLIDDVLGPGKATLDVKATMAEPHEVGDEFVAPIVARVKIANLTVTVAASYRLEVFNVGSADGDHIHKMKAKSCILEDQRLLRPDDQERPAIEYLERIVESLEDETKVLQWWDIPDGS